MRKQGQEQEMISTSKPEVNTKEEKSLKHMTWSLVDHIFKCLISLCSFFMKVVHVNNLKNQILLAGHNVSRL